PENLPSARHRLRRVLWTGATTEVEILLAMAIALRGLWMLSPWWNSLPLDIDDHMIPANLPEWGYGLILMGCALGQLIVATHRFPTGRALVAAFIAMFQGSVLIAYWDATYFYRAGVPFIIAITLGEWWVSWRAWTDRLSAGQLPDRRRHG
nr:hypothetical protein [Gemmatimonadales bacterium]